MLFVPNALFSTISVQNNTRMTHRRIYEVIGIRYEDADKMAEVVAMVKKMLIENPEIDTTRTLIVNFTTFAPSSLDFFIYTFTKTTNWAEFHQIKEDILLKTFAIIRELGADIAFPTSTLHLPEGVALRGDPPPLNPGWTLPLRPCPRRRINTWAGGNFRPIPPPSGNLPGRP